MAVELQVKLSGDAIFTLAAVMPLLVIAPERMRVNQSLGLVTAPKMVADSKPQCIMQLAHLGSFPTPYFSQTSAFITSLILPTCLSARG